MAYVNLMVVMTLGCSNREVVTVARDLAQRLRSGLMGVGACRPIQAVCADLQVPARVFEEDRKQRARHAAHAERELRSLLEGHVDRVEWRERSTMRPLAEGLAHEARSADLVLVGAPVKQADQTRLPDICDLVMNIARPVLIVPPMAADTAGKRILVGWKDTRETHRAISDAMPLLQAAQDVVLAGIAATGELAETTRQMTEVNDWLARHQVKARNLSLPARGANASQFVELAEEIDAGLIVAGAYGYMRHSQWILGGVTEELMHRPKRLTLLSH
jgi:nucleotide-binding universal stress UspA family protein